MSIEPTFIGYIETTQDTLLLFEACRRGNLVKISRRLQEKERKIITSGSVFIFDERESGIKRWTDGLLWSPSRILGNFLIYRELDKRTPAGKKETTTMERQRSNSTDTEFQVEKNKERALVGSLTNTYRFKKGGLIKKTMSIMVNGVNHHMISYYTKEDVLACKLKIPSAIPDLAILEIAPEFLLKQNFRIPPVIESNYEQSELNSKNLISYEKQSPSTTASHHTIITKSDENTSRLRAKIENSNSSGVNVYYSGSLTHNYPNTYNSHGHNTTASNVYDGSHTLPIPSVRGFMNRQSYEFPPLISLGNNTTPRLLSPLMPGISSQIDYNNYYHQTQNNSNGQNSSWHEYQYPSYSSNASHPHNSGSHLPSMSHQSQSSNHHAETGSDMFYTATTTHNINTLNDQDHFLPDLYSSARSSTVNTVSHSQSHQHDQATSPSPTLPSISSPASTASTSNNNSSNNDPVTPLSSPGNTTTIVNSGFNSNYSPYYSSFIKNDAVSMPSNSFMYGHY
ncbi:Gti1/Pac2 family-domain-containing protein [Gigaspora margarita]|uniref:Gti1/Pac2 family-domain-containing protein n=1 Tax=Gigaspora margarita TaxID=4874 RepID=A0A8H4A4W3_GIGMA|nr:Gti1/Pac2 family-domain-containing protein [Gigaspora margarita]